MVVRWFALILGVVLIQGLAALSPIPIPEDEWAEFARMLRDPLYRLPTSSKPQRYEVSLTPYFDNPPSPNKPFTFDGEVVIYTTITEPTNEIVLHCNDLTIHKLTLELNGVSVPLANNTFTCEMPYSFLRVRANSALQVGLQYVIKSTFTGRLQENMRGFYRSWYVDGTGKKRWMGTTQFQPGHARQAFPCYDEPVFKALFDITIIRERDFEPTISNMPIKNRINIANTTRVSETFHTTPLTSTYLLAFIVSHYETVATNNDTIRPFHIFARNNVGTTGQWSLDIGVKLLDAMDKYTQIPYYEMANYIDMKQAAIPDFSAGAMENWGLLTYREANILYDEKNSNHFYKQRVANIVAHEIAHMWFGNLVTCAWWDNLWLNEGFARFYQYYLTQMVAPELGYDTRFIVEQLHVAMLSDSVDSAHALTNPDVNDPTSVSAHFSTITYARGASILRMTQYLMGEETYLKGLRSYLKERKFDVAEPRHLFQALDAAATSDGTLSSYGGLTIDSYFKTWSEKAGHPLLTVNVNQATGRVSVTQARWERDTGVSKFSGTWDIPITWTRASSPDFNNLKPNFVMSAQAISFDTGSRTPQWVLFNKQQSGFYRVNYDHSNWVLITRALRSAERTTIHEYNKAQIVDDLFNFARAGLMTYDRIFNILSFLEFEDQYAPWIAAITGYNFARRRLAHDSTNLQKLHDQILNSSKAVVARLGYEERPGESFMDGMLRMYLMSFLCDVGDQQCASVAKNYFQRFKEGQPVPANMRPWVYCSGLRQGNADDFNYFWNRYLNEQLANEVVVMLQAAGCTSDTGSLEAFLNAIVDGKETVRSQDHATALNSAVTGNEANTMKMFDWLKRNLNQTITGLGNAVRPVSNIGSRLLNDAQIAEFQSWLDQNRNVLGSAYNTGVNAIKTSTNNLAWSGRRLPEFVNFFNTGYVDERLDFEEEEDNEDNETEGGDNVDGDENDTGSANIAALSVVTLLLAVSFNLFA